jgi:redox-sensitive bicupin YhaK (pirin superfamily)
MTAGSGMQHAEMFPLLYTDGPNTCELFQIWLNLPSSKKFVTPSYKMLWAESIPIVAERDKSGNLVEIDLVAGSYKHFKAPAPTPDSWAANPENEVIIWQIKLSENAEFIIPPAVNEVNRTLYFFEGETISIEEKKLKPMVAIELNARNEITVINGSKAARLLMLQGKPIGEPVVPYGPFVMNSMEEIEQAFTDFRKTQFGGWPWPRPDMVHEKNSGRFARYEDGAVERMP